MNPPAVAHSQREIDALISRGAGAPPANEPRPWKLSRTLPSSRAERARLDAVHARFARSLEVHLAAVLQQPVEVALSGVERVPAGELLASLDTPAAAFAVRLNGAEGSEGLFDLGADLALSLVERLLGGPNGAEATHRALTGFEQALLRGVAGRALTLLAESWNGIEPTRLDCGAFVSDPAILNLEADEPMLAAHLSVRVGEERRDVVVALPLAALGTRVREAPAGPAQDAGAMLGQQLRRANIDVRVRFPELRVSTRTLAALVPGQVLDTQHPSDAGFEIRVNGRVRFRGQIGQVRRHLGVRIAEIANPADDTARPLEGRLL